LPHSAPIQSYTLRNSSGVEVGLIDSGAAITSIKTKDRQGRFADIVLGYRNAEDYRNPPENPYFGAIVGRCANRIARGRFTLNGKTYRLATNDGPNHLHGGLVGFDKVIWDSRPIPGKEGSGVEFTYLSKDGEEGYPGNLTVRVSYRLTEENELTIDYEATADAPTPVNLSNHVYFNLAGEGSASILNHDIAIYASRFTPIDETLIPTGTIAEVQGTPFDFTSPKPIGRDIGKEDRQLRFGLGYDHNFVIDRGTTPGQWVLAARVHEPTSGRQLEVWTEEPGIQFYSGNFLNGRIVGKSGKPYVHRSGFCLETQHFPDSPNHPNFPNTILHPGDTLRTKTGFRFSVE